MACDPGGGELLVSPIRALQAGGSSRFNPLSLDWHTVYWAEGPEFKAQGYESGDLLSTIPDEIGSDNLSCSASSGFYFDTGTSMLGDSHTFSNNGASGPGPKRTTWLKGNPTLPYTIVCIAETYSTSSSSTGNYYWRSEGVGGAVFQEAVDSASSPAVLNAGDTSFPLIVSSFGNFSALANTPHAYRSTVTSGTDQVYLDGSSAGTNWRDAGDSIIKGVTLMSIPSGGRGLKGGIGFWGLYDGSVTSDPGWSDFRDWCFEEYGMYP